MNAPTPYVPQSLAEKTMLIALLRLAFFHTEHSTFVSLPTSYLDSKGYYHVFSYTGSAEFDVATVQDADLIPFLLCVEFDGEQPTVSWLPLLTPHIDPATGDWTSARLMM